MSPVSMDGNFREKLIAVKQEIKELSPVQRFLEKEICLPLPTVSAAAGAIIIVAGILISTLLLPGEVPQPGYRIVEMQASQVQLY